MAVLAVRESLSPPRVVLAEPKGWAALGELLRFRVQRPERRHFDLSALSRHTVGRSSKGVDLRRWWVYEWYM